LGEPTPLPGEQFHVVQFGRRGHGRTDNPSGGDAYTLAPLAADAAALIEQQLGLAPATSLAGARVASSV
jgi:pimeloyl-ACP methyl ester carboxylesterase